LVIASARKDGQSVTPDGEFVGLSQIDGVSVMDLRPVLTRNGATIETFRAGGVFGGFEVKQVNYCPLRAGCTSDWHMHRRQNDVLIPVVGEVHIGLYDDRDGSATQGKSMVLRVSPRRMSALLIPCGVWHALKNPGQDEAGYITLTDQLYAHADPDDWRLKGDEPALNGIL
jgi:dTDP-4-dehydrorhamnose 3,5-epimerase